MAYITSTIPNTGGGVSIHNDLQGLNEGDYIHLTALEKDKFDNIESLIDLNQAVDNGDSVTNGNSTFSITKSYPGGSELALDGEFKGSSSQASTKFHVGYTGNEWYRWDDLAQNNGNGITLGTFGHNVIDSYTNDNSATLSMYPTSIANNVYDNVTGASTNTSIQPGSFSIYNTDGSINLARLYFSYLTGLSISMNGGSINGQIKSDLLTNNRTYQLPDEDGEIALKSDMTSFKSTLFTWTSGLQEFVIPETFSSIALVFLNGQQIDKTTQWTNDATKVTIIDTLEVGDVITVFYSIGILGTSPFYTKVEADLLLNDKQDKGSVSPTGFVPPKLTGSAAEALTGKVEGMIIYAIDGSGSVITSKGWWGWNGTTFIQF